jgi:hypothetical protein
MEVNEDAVYIEYVESLWYPFNMSWLGSRTILNEMARRKMPSTPDTNLTVVVQNTMP